MRSYRSLVAWQKAHGIALSVLRLTSSSRTPDTWALYDQLRRAAISAEANIVEGYALATSPLFKRHVRIAIGSAAEVECLLGLASEVKLIDQSETESLHQELDELIAVLRGILRSTKRFEIPTP